MFGYEVYILSVALFRCFRLTRLFAQFFLSENKIKTNIRKWYPCTGPGTWVGTVAGRRVLKIDHLELLKFMHKLSEALVDQLLNFGLD